MAKLRLVSERDPDPADLETVRQGLYRFNMQRMNEWHYLDIAIFLRDEANAVQGGLLGTVWSGWFHVEFLWIADEHQRQGYGDQLLRAAEAEARAYGATHAYLETFSFQARGFYERYGYQVAGQLNDYPPGQTYYFLSKSFDDKE